MFQHRQKSPHVEVVKPAELTPDLIAAWSDIQQRNASLHSPFFRPEFVQAVAEVRNDVRIAVLEDAGQPVGFFPFQRDARGIGHPAGGWMSDFHGIVADADVSYSPAEIVRASGLSAWYYNHVPYAQAPFQPHHWPWIAASSPYLDLTGGFEAYRARRKKSRSDELAQTMRKARKIQRELGALRLETHTTNLHVLNQLIDWKTQQYRQMRVRNYLGPQWVIELIENLIRRNDPELQGMLSTVYVDDRPAAIHLALRWRHVLHSWAPAYDPALSRYSPGLILLIELAQAAESLGVTRFELGKGDEPYKRRFMTGATPLAEGCVDFRRVSRTFWRHVSRTREFVRSSRLKTPAQKLVRSARAWFMP